MFRNFAIIKNVYMIGEKLYFLIYKSDEIIIPITEISYFIYSIDFFGRSDLQLLA